MSAELKRRARDGAVSGLYYGGCFAGVTVLAILLDAQATEQRLHAPPLRVAAFYLVSGAVIGLTAGLVQPILRTRAACLLFGFIIMIPVTAAGTTLVKGLAYATSTTAMTWTLLIALIVGVIGGSILGPLR